MAYTRYTSRATEIARMMAFSITGGLHFQIQVVAGDDVGMPDTEAKQVEEDKDDIFHGGFLIRWRRWSGGSRGVTGTGEREAGC
jgi:hypothetical protein